MELQALQAGMDARVRVPADLWAWAYLLGHARWRSNELRRGWTRDRGDQVNVDNDIAGAFTELFLLRRLLEGGPSGRPIPDSDEAARWMGEHLFTPEGGADQRIAGADLELVEASGRPVALDAKSLIWQPNKRFFAINNKKHTQLQGRCQGYYCILGRTLALEVVVARLVPYGDVDRWLVKQLGRHPDRARVAPLESFLERYSSRIRRKEQIPAEAHDPAEVHTLCFNQAVRSALIARVGSLTDDWLPQPRCTNHLGEACAFCHAAGLDRLEPHAVQGR